MLIKPPLPSRHWCRLFLYQGATGGEEGCSYTHSLAEPPLHFPSLLKREESWDWGIKLLFHHLVYYHVRSLLACVQYVTYTCLDTLALPLLTHCGLSTWNLPEVYSNLLLTQISPVWYRTVHCWDRRSQHIHSFQLSSRSRYTALKLSFTIRTRNHTLPMTNFQDVLSHFPR
jgi:hypothetical protein